MQKVDRAVAPYPKAALFELYEAGYRSTFEILSACLISIRTRDEVTLPTALHLFEAARTPAEAVALGPAGIDERIKTCPFHERKAAQIFGFATAAVEQFGGRLPCDRETLLQFKGVGPKCANLALSIACGQPLISVDIHVHRIVNRWGYVKTGTPEETLSALEAVLPEEYWVAINRLLVPFGKQVCTGRKPRCHECTVRHECSQIDIIGQS
jgi:endonuclease-3